MIINTNEENIYNSIENVIKENEIILNNEKEKIIEKQKKSSLLEKIKLKKKLSELKNKIMWLNIFKNKLSELKIFTDFEPDINNKINNLRAIAQSLDIASIKLGINNRIFIIKSIDKEKEYTIKDLINELYKYKRDEIINNEENLTIKGKQKIKIRRKQ